MLMEKKCKREVLTVKTIHEFYCDKCGAKIGESTECEDGTYEPVGWIDMTLLQIIHNTGQTKEFRLDKHFCNDCKMAFLENVKKFWIELGFQ